MNNHKFSKEHNDRASAYHHILKNWKFTNNNDTTYHRNVTKMVAFSQKSFQYRTEGTPRPHQQHSRPKGGRSGRGEFADLREREGADDEEDPRGVAVHGEPEQARGVVAVGSERVDEGLDDDGVLPGAALEMRRGGISSTGEAAGTRREQRRGGAGC